MAAVVINGDTSGSVTLQAPAAAGSTTITLPSTSGTLASIASVNNNGVVYANSSGQPTTSTALTFDGTNLGIGTSSPSYKLDVQGATANQRISSTTGTNAAYQIFSNTGQNFYVGLDNSAGNQILSAVYGATLLGSGAYPMVFGTNNTERMRIDSSGNLLVGTTSASTPSTTGFISTANTFGFKNRLINGAMVIDQRNAGASVTPTISTTYSLDRWGYAFTQASKASIQQNASSVTTPAGFTNYLGFTSLSAYAVLASDIFTILQPIEGFNTADLGWGTANAATITLSFWVRSSLTGTFGGSLANSAVNRSYPFTYTISSANTWEQKTITVSGDTTGTWIGATNGVGMYVRFGVGVGSTYSGTAGAWAGADYRSATGAQSVVGTNGATFYITGVQLEKGSTATSFDYRPYGTELKLCQRYFFRTGNPTTYSGSTDGSGNTVLCVILPTTMRSAPSVTNTRTGARGFDGFFAYPASSSTTTTSLSYTFGAAADLGANGVAVVYGGSALSKVGYLNIGQDSYLSISAEL